MTQKITVYKIQIISFAISGALFASLLFIFFPISSELLPSELWLWYSVCVLLFFSASASVLSYIFLKKSRRVIYIDSGLMTYKNKSRELRIPIVHIKHLSYSRSEVFGQKNLTFHLYTGERETIPLTKYAAKRLVKITGKRLEGKKPFKLRFSEFLSDVKRLFVRSAGEFYPSRSEFL